MRLEDLIVYRESHILSNEIWDIVDQWNDFQKDTVGKQLVRSADSVSANIAEGYGRFTYTENRRFCVYSRGSICETLSWIDKAQYRKLIPPEKAGLLKMKIARIMIMLNKYMASIMELKTSK
jgi:four helix bundle protein